MKSVNISSNITVSNQYSLINCNCGVALNLTLDKSYSIKGHEVTIRKTDSSDNTITITPATGETVNETTTYTVSLQNEYVTLTATENGWSVIDAGYSLTSIVTLAGTQTLTNKIMTTPVVESIYQDAGKTKLMSLPDTASDTIVTLAAQQTLSSKTLATPTVTGALTAPKIKLTVEGGIAVLLTNKTSATSVKGTVVKAASGTNNAVTKIVVNIPDPIGVIYESGIADGQEVWVVISGIAEVYYIGNTTRDYLARGFMTADSGYVSGQALAEAVPTSPFSTDKHFYEIGHVLESRTGAGLAKTILHFN